MMSNAVITARVTKAPNYAIVIQAFQSALQLVFALVPKIRPIPIRLKSAFVTKAG
jgi:hypothetical protein